MLTPEDERYEQYREKIKGFKLFDDDFMIKCFEDDKRCTELVLRILLDKNDLKVTDAKTQYVIKNLQGRSVRLDVRATDSENNRYNIEIQRDDHGAGKKRARHNSAMLDASILQPSEDAEELPETYVIFITENDVLGMGNPIYPVERCIMSGEKPVMFGDGSHILYVNGAFRDDTSLGKLMHDFSCTEPDDMIYQVLADRVRYFKEDKEGVKKMCKVMEELRSEALAQGMAQGMARGMIKAYMDTGMSVRDIAEKLSMPENEVEEIIRMLEEA